MEACGKTKKKNIYSLLFMNTFKSLEFAFNDDCATHILIHCDMHMMSRRYWCCDGGEKSGSLWVRRKRNCGEHM